MVLPEERDFVPMTETDAIIVGAGAAGLYAADCLRRAGISFVVLEAQPHSGGRVHSRPEMDSMLGLTLDEGANLINSTDTLAIRLMNRFSITYVRRLAPGADGMQYFYRDRCYDQAEMDALLFSVEAPAMEHIALGQEVWIADDDRANDPRFIYESIAAFFARIGAGDTLTTLMQSFFWSEYGRDLQDLNLHVLYDYLHVDAAQKQFRLIPNVDEAYTVPGGLEQITRALEAQSHNHIRYGRWVTRIADANSDHVSVEARTDGAGIETYQAQVLFYAAPLHSLRKIDVSVEGLTAVALAEARSATYAQGTKLHLKFKRGFHKLYRYSGILLTDTGEQIWPSSTGQGGAGLLTVLTGPVPSDDAVMIERVQRVLRVLDILVPGISEQFVGAERSEAPMSYSGALRPGDDGELDLASGGKRWFTLGEAASHELQGYFEGALRTAKDGTSRFIMKHTSMFTGPSARVP
jgi:monoamine oxidase